MQRTSKVGLLPLLREGRPLSGDRAEGGGARAISPPPTVCRRGRGRLAGGGAGGQVQVPEPRGPRSGQEWLRPRESLGRGAGVWWWWWSRVRHWRIGGRGLTDAVPSTAPACSASEMAIFNSSFMGGEGVGAVALCWV